KITNINNCHIFTSIMGKKDKEKFSIRVEYNDEFTPLIVVHQIKNKTSQHNKHKKSPISIGWIIVGQPNNFDFDQSEYPIVLKSKKYSVSSKIDKHYKVENLEIHESDNTCILSTCILRAPKPTETTIIINARIIPSSSSSSIFIHDLRNTGDYEADATFMRRLELLVW
ncbi:2093_t:CDS:1, partial [Scutellospora calospora]